MLALRYLVALICDCRSCLFQAIVWQPFTQMCCCDGPLYPIDLIFSGYLSALHYWTNSLRQSNQSLTVCRRQTWSVLPKDTYPLTEFELNQPLKVQCSEAC